MPVSRFEVQEWMTPAPETAGPECTVLEARRMMDAGGFRHLPVVEQGRVIGIVSDRDLRTIWPSIVLSAGEKETESQLDRIAIRQIMTQKPLVVGPHTSLADATRLLVDHQVGALPVLSGDEIVGIFSESDALRALLAVLALIQNSRRSSEVWQQ